MKVPWAVATIPRPRIRAHRLLLLAFLVAGCAHQPPPQPAPTIGAPRTGGISLRNGWRATVLVERNDSIILSLPSGDKQLQRFDRRAGFTLALDRDGRISLRLDSLTVRPTSSSADGVPVGATWAGQAGDSRVDAIRATGGGEAAAEFTAVVRNLLPRLPAGGVRARMTWADSASGEIQVDVFKGSEHRTASWWSGELSGRSSGQVLPVQLREDFEQLGDGSQGGHRLTMTSQGRRSATYYLRQDGQISGAELRDSVAMLISIPATKQVVPTMRYSRTSVRFVPAGRDESR